MPTIKQASMDEAALMTRVLSLFGQISRMFQDHGRRPLTNRAERIKEFVSKETKRKNPYDTCDPEKGYPHQFFIVEVLGEEVLHVSNLGDLHYAVTDGHYSGETFESPVTYVNRALMDELLMDQGSDASFLSKGEEDEP